MNFPATQPVSASALPLPTGAATQTTSAAILSALGTPFQAGGSIGNASFGISGTLPAFAAPPTVNLGTIAGASTSALQTTIAGDITALGTGLLATDAHMATLLTDVTNLGSTALVTDAHFTGDFGTAALFGTGAPGTAPTNGLQVLGKYNSAGVTLTNGQAASFQLTSSGQLLTSCSNCSGSGASLADEAAMTFGTTSFAPMGGVFQTSPTSNALTTGQGGWAQLTANRALFSSLRNADATDFLGSPSDAAWSGSGNPASFWAYNKFMATSPMPAGTNLIGFTTADPCATASKLSADFSSSSSGGNLITGTSSKITYICSLVIANSKLAHVSLCEATSTACSGGTPAAVMLNTGVTAANGATFGIASTNDGGGATFGDGGGTVGKTATTGQNIDVLFDTTNSPQVNVHATYVQQ
jgi:hypothetical protein